MQCIIRRPIRAAAGGREAPVARAAQRVQQLPLHSARTSLRGLHALPPRHSAHPIINRWIWLWSKSATCSVVAAFYETNQVTMLV
jgi:hypothetical protein